MSRVINARVVDIRKGDTILFHNDPSEVIKITYTYNTMTLYFSGAYNGNDVKTFNKNDMVLLVIKDCSEKNIPSRYARWFDSSSHNHVDNAELNNIFLR